MLEKFVKCAKKAEPADIVLKNANYLDVYSGKIRTGDIAIVCDKIVGIGNYDGKEEIDCSNLFILPGFIDGHVHIESSQLSPEEFAALIVPHGTTTIIADPHEITNVCGVAGYKYIIEASKRVPLDVKINLPSCVPATPFETSGATLSGEAIEEHIFDDEIFALGEFMNYPALIGCDPDAHKKAEAAIKAGKIIDGHAPLLRGEDLNAYLCCGVSTDHECSDGQEIDEKISKGMYLHIRYGSSANNLANAKYVTDSNSRRFLLCTDDRHAASIKEHGHIDGALRELAKTMDPIRAVTLATLNAAECYNLRDRGAIAPNKTADLVAVDDMKNFNVKFVFKSGKKVAEGGKPLFDTSKKYLPANVLNTVHLRKISESDFEMDVKSDRLKAITLTPKSIVTGCEVVKVKRSGGDIDVKGTDLNKLAVVERHKLTGNIGKGILKGYGFKGGAMGTTVAHDSHNLIILGDDNKAMARVANRLKEIGGGMAIAQSGGEIYSVTFDIAGLMSSADADTLQKDSKRLLDIARKMGVKEGFDPFMTLAFLSLAVIPELKLLDTGLFDVNKFGFTSLEE